MFLALSFSLYVFYLIYLVSRW